MTKNQLWTTQLLNTRATTTRYQIYLKSKAPSKPHKKYIDNVIHTATTLTTTKNASISLISFFNPALCPHRNDSWHHVGLTSGKMLLFIPTNSLVKPVPAAILTIHWLPQYDNAAGKEWGLYVFGLSGSNGLATHVSVQHNYGINTALTSAIRWRYVM